MAIPTPNPARIPEFYTLTKIHKPTITGRLIISGCDGPTERNEKKDVSCFDRRHKSLHKYTTKPGH